MITSPPLGVRDREGEERDPVERVVGPVDRIEKDGPGIASDLDPAALLGDEGAAEPVPPQVLDDRLFGHLVETFRLGVHGPGVHQLASLDRVDQRQGHLLDRRRDLVARLPELHVFLPEISLFHGPISASRSMQSRTTRAGISEVFM